LILALNECLEFVLYMRGLFNKVIFIIGPVKVSNI
jgi:hypothetical protein